MTKQSLKEILKVVRLPPSCNRPDVRLLNNRIWPHPSEVGAVSNRLGNVLIQKREKEK